MGLCLLIGASYVRSQGQGQADRDREAGRQAGRLSVRLGFV